MKRRSKEKAPEPASAGALDAKENDVYEDDHSAKRRARQVAALDVSENHVVNEGEAIGDWSLDRDADAAPDDLAAQLEALKVAQESNDADALAKMFKAWGRRAAWTGILYPEMRKVVEDAEGKDWVAVAEGLHTPMLMSPFHDQDVVMPKMVKKKGHWHVILYVPAGKLSYQQARAILGDRLGLVMVEPVLAQGALVRYFCHLDCEPFEVSGKMRYPESALVPISGYDPMPYLWYRIADQTSGRKAIMAFAKRNGIYQYSDLVDAIDEANRPDWDYLMAIPSMRTAIRDYMQNRWHACKDGHVPAALQEIERQQHELAVHAAIIKKMASRLGVDLSEFKGV